MSYDSNHLIIATDVYNPSKIDARYRGKTMKEI
jgi:hypothetical protein